MNTLTQTKQILAAQKEYVSQKYNVASLGIFGSVVRNEAESQSDVDILVEFTKPISFFMFLELEEYLQEILGTKVDLVSKKALKSHISKQVLSELSPI